MTFIFVGKRGGSMKRYRLNPKRKALYEKILYVMLVVGFWGTTYVIAIYGWATGLMAW